jgi:hypothetical protein
VSVGQPLKFAWGGFPTLRTGVSPTESRPRFGETELGPVHPHNGVSDSAPPKFTEVDGRFSVLVGGRGGLDYRRVGGGGYALANTSNFEHLANGAGDSGRLEMAYGGLEPGYVHRAEGSVHLALGVVTRASPDPRAW